MKLPAAVAPYASLLKWGLITAILFAAFAGGCSVQKGRDADAIAAKNAALENAAVALRASGDALRRQNDENAKRVAAAEREARLKADAEKVARDALADGQRKHAAAVAEWEAAGRRKPACADLLAADLFATCGVMPK